MLLAIFALGMFIIVIGALLLPFIDAVWPIPFRAIYATIGVGGILVVGALAASFVN